jgi:cytochrome P450
MSWLIDGRLGFGKGFNRISLIDSFRSLMRRRIILTPFTQVNIDITFHTLALEYKAEPALLFWLDEHLMCTCTDIVSAALDTTSNSLDFGLLYMMKYPRVQKKVQTELDRVVGKNRIPIVFDRPQLVKSLGTKTISSSSRK